MTSLEGLLRDGTRQTSLSLDQDNNGIVDGSESSAYQLFNDGNPITIMNRRGRTFSHATSRRWDVIAGATHEPGFLVVREKQRRRRDPVYKLWSTNDSGIINGRTRRWASGTAMSAEGYEDIFRIDFDRDGVIGSPDPVEPNPPSDDGDASFAITGNPEVDQLLSISQTASDPDGDGETTITWQASSDNENSWLTIGSDADLTVSSDLEGQHIRAVVDYVDGEGFQESVITPALLIEESPIDDGDDFGTTPDSSGTLTINGSSDGELEIAGDKDWFAISLEAGKNYSFDLIGNSLRDPFLTLRNSNGDSMATNDDGGAGFNSRLGYRADSSATFYLEAGAYADAFAGTYTLSAAELAPPPPGFNPEDGYGHVDAKIAFEQLLNISLPDVPALGGDLWGVDNVNAPEVWTSNDDFSGVTGANVIVAVVDTGVDLNHQEFEGRLTPGYDFVDDDETADDGNSHGTHVAGTIAGARDSSGITGVAPDASIMPIRVLDNNGSGWLSDIIAGVRWAAENDADVINLSLGGGGFSQSMADAIAFASEQGSVVVMAAGNSGGSSPAFPAAHAEAHGLAVGAVNQQRNLAGFSNRAGTTALDYVTAPGVDVYSSIPGDEYARYSGTSMATPHVAGVAALLKSHDNTLDPERIEELLTQTASNNGSADFEQQDQPSTSRMEGNFDNSDNNATDVITLETIDNFTANELKAPLIGNLSGSEYKREKTADKIDQLVEKDAGQFAHIEEFEIIDSTQNNFATMDLSDGKNADRISLLTNLLENNQFEYFEFDQQMTAL